MSTLPPLPDGFFVAGVGDGRAGPEGGVAPSMLVLVGSDARAWEAFVADLQRDPRGLTQERDPFDAWVQRAMTAAGWTDFPHAWCDGASTVDFVALARRCGQDMRGLHGLLLDPVRGPWWAIRGVFRVPRRFAESVAFLGRGGVAPPQRPPDTTGQAHPCVACIAAHAARGAPPPCAAACPGGVIARHDGEGPSTVRGWSLDGGACARFHLADSACATRCAAREACPLGAEARYPPEAVAYHANRRVGRAALRARLGIAPADDPYEGEGPDWVAWAGG